MRRVRRALLLASACVALASGGCSLLVGDGDYFYVGSEAGPDEAGPESDGEGATDGVGGNGNSDDSGDEFSLLYTCRLSVAIGSVVLNACSC